jgi:transcriptional regulator with XRE-family HTH domain
MENSQNTNSELKTHLPFLPDNYVRDLFMNELSARRNRNPQYSKRAFARDLNCSHSTLSEFLSGKKRISPKMAIQWAMRIGIKLSSQEIESIPFVQQKPTASKAFDSWMYNAILELVTLKNFKDDPEWISQQLGIPVMDAYQAFQKLKNLGMIQKTKKNKWMVSQQNPSSLGQTEASQAQDRLALSLLAKQKEVIQSVTLQERSSMGLTIACSSRKLAQIRKLYYDCLSDCLKLLEDEGEKDQIYHLHLTAIPLLQRNRE